MARRLQVESLIRDVNRRLRVYGDSRHFNKKNPLDELLFIILSEQTESYSYLDTYKQLKRRYSLPLQLLKAKQSSIAKTIKSGGLANKKASQIKRALQKIFADTGKVSLGFLSHWDDKDVESYLTSLSGIGVKSARCIMMYSLGRQVFPVDTHVWRVCRRLGLTPSVPKPTPQMERDLQRKIPPHLRYTLHVNLVSHGRETCQTYWPKCDQCCLADICPSKNRPDKVWGKWRDPKGFWQNYANVKKNKTRK